MSFDELIGRPEWMDDAACKGIDPDVFFPERGEDTYEPKKICHGCPVRAECLAYALDNGETKGIWGGLSERERRRVRAAKRERRGAGLRPIQHGTEGGYQAHWRRGDPPCIRCQEAHAAANAEKREVNV